jgi:hypothetical protein
MTKKQNEAQNKGPMQVNINALNDGTVSLVFTRSLTQFTAGANEMVQLGVNLIKAAQVALMQQEQNSVRGADYIATVQPLRKM